MVPVRLNRSLRPPRSPRRPPLAQIKRTIVSFRPGDALLFRFGWARFWTDPAKYGTDPPGIGREVARWVVERRASMVGGDQSQTEVGPNPDPSMAFPVHQELIMKNGIFNIVNLALDELARDRAWEFVFVFTPVRFKGATGSPGRPIAIR